ncbi:MAG TPA: hypothetical protein VEC37_00945 [Bacillota bacterium]|nr:hypothetical protein [Bacillota bacterium]
MTEKSVDFKSSFLSDAGVFVKDKSAQVYLQLENFACWAVADGLEFNETKESARLALEQFSADFNRKPTLNRRMLRKYLENAHNLLTRENEGQALKASLILLVTDYAHVIWAVCGNARLYYFREKQFIFRSQDQSAVEGLTESENLTEYVNQGEDEQHYLTNYLGKQSGFAPFISKKYKMQNGDVMLLCNSGFWENMRYDEMNRVLSTAWNPKDLLIGLQEHLKQKQTLVLNNYIIGAIYANQVLAKPNLVYNEMLTKVVATGVAAVLLLGGGFFIYRTAEAYQLYQQAEAEKTYIADQKRLVLEYETRGDDLSKKGNFLAAASEYNQAINILSNYADKAKEVALQNKYQVAMLINEGDTLANNRNYRLALERYSDANRAALDGFFKVYLSQKTVQIKTKLSTVVKHQPPKPQINQTLALNTTTTGKVPHELIARETGSKLYRESPTSEPTSSKKVNSSGFASQARQLERSGDELVGKEEFKAASRAYKQAIKLYNKSGLKEQARLVKVKQKEVKKQMRRLFVGAR